MYYELRRKRSNYWKQGCENATYYLILRGDMNCVLSPGLDFRSPRSSSLSGAARSIQLFLESYGVVDAMPYSVGNIQRQYVGYGTLQNVLFIHKTNIIYRQRLHSKAVFQNDPAAAIHTVRPQQWCQKKIGRVDCMFAELPFNDTIRMPLLSTLLKILSLGFNKYILEYETPFFTG